MSCVGFIGLGNIGWPMASRLRELQTDFVVQDERYAQAVAFAGDRAQVLRTPREVGDHAEIVLLCLPTPAAVRAVAVGNEGICHGVKTKLVIDLSTTGPSATAEIAQRLQQHGIALIDAPVSGGLAGAANGTLAIIASGASDALARARPLLESLGRIFVVGEKPGQAQTMKLLNNILAANALAATAEVMVLGAKVGLDAAVMIEVLNASSGRNSATADKFPRSVLDRSFNYGFRTVLMHKDVNLCKELADQQGVHFPIGTAVADFWKAAADELGDLDTTHIVELLERRAGVQLKQARKKQAK